MEPTGTTGYFGYCGRDYYSEVGGITDFTTYEAFPSGTHILVPKGATLYLHTYANNFLDKPQAFHHAVAPAVLVKRASVAGGLRQMALVNWTQSKHFAKFRAGHQDSCQRLG